MKTENYSKIIKAFFFFFFSFASIIDIQSQDLTKDETVNYINRRIHENNGHYRTNTFHIFDENKNRRSYAEKIMYNHSSNIEFKDNKIALTTTWGTMNEKYTSYQTFQNYEGKTVYVYPCGYIESTAVYFFSPDKIINIEFFDPKAKENEPIGVILITVSKNSGKVKHTDKIADVSISGEKYIGKCGFYSFPEEYFVESMFLYYLKGDGSEGNKIKKALEYLRDLAKAEDDPFGN
jgi:hypothetical protein